MLPIRSWESEIKGLAHLESDRVPFLTLAVSSRGTEGLPLWGLYNPPDPVPVLSVFPGLRFET